MALRTLGILGGMSWVSTVQYYRMINEQVGAALGRQHSASLLVMSQDFQPIVDAQSAGRWEQAGDMLTAQARSLKAGGAQGWLIASNTMHKVFDHIAAAVDLPGLNIFDATASAIVARGISRVALLGTRYTMVDPFFRQQYSQRGVEVLTPEGSAAERVNSIIFHELIHNRV